MAIDSAAFHRLEEGPLKQLLADVLQEHGVRGVVADTVKLMNPMIKLVPAERKTGGFSQTTAIRDQTSSPTSRIEYRRLFVLARRARANDELLAARTAKRIDEAEKTAVRMQTAHFQSLANAEHNQENTCATILRRMHKTAHRLSAAVLRRSAATSNLEALSIGESMESPNKTSSSALFMSLDTNVVRDRGTKRHRNGLSIQVVPSPSPVRRKTTVFHFGHAVPAVKPRLCGELESDSVLDRPMGAWSVLRSIQHHHSSGQEQVRRSYGLVKALMMEVSALRALQQMAALVQAVYRLPVETGNGAIHEEIHRDGGRIRSGAVSECLRYKSVPRVYHCLATYTGNVPMVGDGTADNETHRLVAAAVLSNFMRLCMANGGDLPGLYLQDLYRAGTPLGGVLGARPLGQPKEHRSFLRVLVDVPVTVSHTILSFLGGHGLGNLRGCCRATYAMEPGVDTPLCLIIKGKGNRTPQPTFNQAIFAKFQDVRISTAGGATLANVRSVLTKLYYTGQPHIRTLHLAMTPLKCMNLVLSLSGKEQAGVYNASDWDARVHYLRRFRVQWMKSSASGDGRDEWRGFFGITTALFPNLQELHVGEASGRPSRDPVLKYSQRSSVVEDFEDVGLLSAASSLELLRQGVGIAMGLEILDDHVLVGRAECCMQSVRHLSICVSQNGQDPFLQIVTKFRSLLSLIIDTSPMFPGVCVVPILLQTMKKNPLLETVCVELGRRTKDIWRIGKKEDQQLLETKAAIGKNVLDHWPPALRSFEVGCDDPGILATIPRPLAAVGRRSLSVYLRESVLRPNEVAVHARSLVEKACHRRPMTVSIFSGGNWNSIKPEAIMICDRW